MPNNKYKVSQCILCCKRLDVPPGSPTPAHRDDFGNPCPAKGNSFRTGMAG
ncbi:hypothetical protein [Planomonospora sp. ID82291]|uniref:hypothetical protein n=1 Tax=Planomonospora sp. ID82291 TaxID=2738136 RepID=UPI0018C37CAF|nr:hypothetical protein [Planomonospora sp. ID82291]MBG0818915.1 hypothetical protein [Planomonospora sp. ID82291]